MRVFPDLYVTPIPLKEKDVNAALAVRLKTGRFKRVYLSEIPNHAVSTGARDVFVFANVAEPPVPRDNVAVIVADPDPAIAHSGCQWSIFTVYGGRSCLNPQVISISIGDPMSSELLPKYITRRVEPSTFPM